MRRQIVDMLMQYADFLVHFAAESHVTRSIWDDTTFFETESEGGTAETDSIDENLLVVLSPNLGRP